ncbi:hypothetical protein ACVU7I_19045, partial [Patulibacter sp. S7RM1-6]
MRNPSPISRWCAAVAVVCALGAVALLAPGTALLLAPAAVLVLVLLLGVFPGEEALARARERRLRSRRVRAPGRLRRPALPDLARPT